MIILQIILIIKTVLKHYYNFTIILKVNIYCNKCIFFSILIDEVRYILDFFITYVNL